MNAGAADYLVECVRRAEAGGFTALLVRLDTPGGALESTREIVRAFLGARVPILLWVGPPGARAGSAGVFLTLAAHVAGMAPGTNIGAAHPVEGLTGADPKERSTSMGEKVLNDTAAFAEAIARQRGRNAEWAAQAVRESVSVDAERALALKVVDVLSLTEEAFVAAAEGRTVQLAQGPQIIRTAGAARVELAPKLHQRMLQWLAHPAIAYVLLLVAGLGVMMELAHPGLIAPGLIGLVSGVLALMSLSALPFTMGAVLLLGVGAALIAAELFVASGLLGAGGVLLLVLGGLFLFEPVSPEWFTDRSFTLPLRLIVPMAVVLGGLAVFLAVRSAQTRRLAYRSGPDGMVGEHGQVLIPFVEGKGEVFVHGERWSAKSSGPLAPGMRIHVTRVEGLTLHVEREHT